MTLVERLRGMIGDADWSRLRDATEEAADRIEVLEKDVEDWAGGAADYALRIKVLEAALREIELDAWDRLGSQHLAAIARKALGEK